MLIVLPADFERDVKEIALNPAHIVSVVPTGGDSCQVETTGRLFHVRLPFEKVLARLACDEGNRDAESAR